MSHPWKRKAESFSPTCSNCVPWPHIIRTPNPGLAIFIYTIQHLSSPIDDFMNVSQLAIINSLALGTFSSYRADPNSLLLPL